MIEHAWMMKFKPGCGDEYQRRHDAVWPELAELLRRTGIRDYWIYLDESTHTLFAVQKLADGYTSDELANEPVMRRWWDHRADIMETNRDGSPVCLPLGRVFHLD